MEHSRNERMVRVMCNTYQSVFARVEKKFILDAGQAAQIIQELRSRGFQEIAFGSPLIQSVYYDTPDYLLARRSIERPVYKEKLRLRAYGQPDANAPGYAEIKKKVNGIVYKRRVELPLMEAPAMLMQGCLPESTGQIGREINWFVRRYPGLSPAAMIAYERLPLELPEEGLRLTFDRNIRCRFDDFDLTHPAVGTPLLKPGQVLLEVKVPGAYPLWLVRLLNKVGARQSHFSKYGTAYTEYLSKVRRSLRAAS